MHSRSETLFLFLFAVSGVILGPAAAEEEDGFILDFFHR
jgi:hypothetical protein